MIKRYYPHIYSMYVAIEVNFDALTISYTQESFPQDPNQFVNVSAVDFTRWPNGFTEFVKAASAIEVAAFEIDQKWSF